MTVNALEKNLLHFSETSSSDLNTEHLNLSLVLNSNKRRMSRVHVSESEELICGGEGN